MRRLRRRAGQHGCRAAEERERSSVFPADCECRDEFYGGGDRAVLAEGKLSECVNSEVYWNNRPQSAGSPERLRSSTTGMF